MDRRNEPRLPTETPVRVEALRGGTVEIEGMIVNTSGRGLRVRLPRELTAGELVRLIADQHHTIAMVRYCQSEDGQFSAGLERAGEWRARLEGAPLQDLSALPVPQAASPGELKVDLDGVRNVALQEMFEGAVKETARARSKTPLVVAGVAGLLVLGALLGVWKMGSQQSAAAQPVEVAPPVAVTAEPARPVVAAAEQPAAQALVRTVGIEVRGNSWVLFCADGKRVTERMFTAGQRAEFPYAEQALLRAGNAQAVAVTLGTKSLGRLGTSGGVRAWRFAGDAHEEAPASSTGECGQP